MCEIGSYILKRISQLKVDVHKPVESMWRSAIRHIYSVVIAGPGGMPVGTNSRAMLLYPVEDSPVSGYMISASMSCQQFIFTRLHIPVKEQLEGSRFG